MKTNEVLNMAYERTGKCVFCIFCGEAIPLHPRLASLALSRNRSHTKAGVLTLHCRTCCKDAPYSIREIVPLDSRNEGAELDSPRPARST